YELPFLKRFKGVAGAFLGGWQTNGIITLRSGFPFNPGCGGCNLNVQDNGLVRPDRLADGRLFSAATREKWFEPAAFQRVDCRIPTRPDLCHYGNAGQGILETPGAKNFDLSVYKNWPLPLFGEGGRLQFRTELFNAFNTPQFS